MKSRPMLFKGAMIRGLLRPIDPKEQTRRIIKPQPTVNANGMTFTNRNGRFDGFIGGAIPDPIYFNCPYGIPGDQIWVRESCTIGQSWNGIANVCYRADGDVELGPDRKWTPSIHMPRWASRITLETTEVRVQRLQDISEEDAKAEGAEIGVSCNGLSLKSATCLAEFGISGLNRYRLGYAWLWEQINGPGSWNLNPYVWAITFRRIGQAK